MDEVREVVERLRNYASMNDHLSWRSKCEREAAALLERLSPEAVRDDGWQPIETAPRDGAAFLLLCGYLDGPHDPRIKMGYWDLDTKVWVILGASWKPVLWRPIPPPPAIRKDAPDA